jgi:hypothetical protein
MTLGAKSLHSWEKLTLQVFTIENLTCREDRGRISALIDGMEHTITTSDFDAACSALSGLMD